MAKIVITIEDKPDGKVEMKCNPTFQQLMNKLMGSGEETLCGAEGYAFRVMEYIWRDTKDRAPQQGKLLIPRRT